MPNIHPNMHLSFKLDPIDDTPENRQEIRRSYAFVVGSIDFEDSEPSGFEQAAEGNVDTAGCPVNEITLNVSLHVPFWDKGDKRSESNWPAFETWLEEKLRKVSNALTGVNATRARENRDPFDFGWLNLNLSGKALVTIRLGANSSIDGRTRAMVAAARDLWQSESLAGSPTRVTIPSRRSFAAQLALAFEKQRTAQTEIEGAPGGDGQLPAGLDHADAIDDAVSEDSGCAECPAPTSPSVPVFDIDYGTWEVEFADGSTVEFDRVI